MKAEIAQLYTKILDLFFPEICEGCGVGGAYICESCLNSKVQYVMQQACHVCKTGVNEGLVHKMCREKTHLDGVFIAAHYSKFLEDFIGDIKYEFYHAMLDDLIKVLIKGLSKQFEFLSIINDADTILTFVPLYPSRKRWRGFNQAEKIARGISRHFRVPCQKLLERKKQTHSQMGLPRSKRLKNVQGVFSCKKHLEIEPQHSVIIVDDVMTSGATLEVCAEALRQCGVETIYGLVCARG